jgi:hypothetical protein
MFRDLEQVQNAKESRLARQFRSNIWESYWLNRIDLTLAFLHTVSCADSDVGTRPDSHTAFLLAVLLAVLGFLQIGFRRWFQRDTSRFLFWVFLLLGLGLAFDYWTLALATRFFSLTDKMQSDQAHRAYEISRMLAGYFLKPIVAIGLLNIGLALLHKRSRRLVPG